MAKIPHHIQREITKTQSAVEKYITSIYISCFNCLEDQRIESLTREVWLATGDMFDTCRTNCGNEMTVDNMRTPSDHLLAARFHRPELTKSRYINAMKIVEKKGKKGAIAVMQEIKDLIDEDIGRNITNSLTNMKNILNDARKTEGEIPVGHGKNHESISSEYKEAVRKFDGKRTQYEKDNEKPNVKDLIQKFTDYTKVEILQKQKQKQSQEVKQELQNIVTLEKKESVKKSSLSDHVQMGDESNNANEVEKTRKGVQLSETEKDGKREVNFILEKMYNNAVPKEPAHILTSSTINSP